MFSTLGVFFYWFRRVIKNRAGTKGIAALTDPIITKATFIVIPSKMTPTREAHARARAANNYPRNSIQQASGVLLKWYHHCRRGDLDCFGSFLLAVQLIPKTSMFPFVQLHIKMWTHGLENEIYTAKLSCPRHGHHRTISLMSVRCTTVIESP
jgi:hypothetical protein